MTHLFNQKSLRKQNQFANTAGVGEIGAGRRI